MNIFNARLRTTPTLRANEQQVREDWCAENGHEYTVKQDVIGDYEVINGTQTVIWKECENCGHQASADYADLHDPFDFYEG
jgi:hypothetical protein